MKILILQDNFPPQSFGGAGKVAFNLSLALQKRGHQVFIISTRQNKSLPETENFGGLKVFRIFANYHQRWRGYLSIYNPQTIKKVKELMREIRPDVVHAHNIHYYLSYYCLKSAKKYSKKVFLTAHDAMLFNCGKLTIKQCSQSKNPSIRNCFNYRVNWLDQLSQEKKRYNPFKNFLIKRYLKYIDKIFSVSRALKDALNQNGIKNVEAIHNGIDVNDWQIDNEKISSFKNKYNLQNKKIVLFGGRLSGLKGGEKVILAMKKVIEECPEAILLVIGRKEGYALEMLKMAQELGIKDNFIFTDWLDGDELKSAYSCSNLAVILSICFDSFPTMNLEAMACGKPVIGTCFGGTPEVVQDGVTGYIVNPFNTEITAKKIIYLLKNPQKAEEMGRNGYNRVKQDFSLNSQINKTIAWYQKALDKK